MRRAFMSITLLVLSDVYKRQEVRTPLNVIVGFSELLASASTGEEEILLLLSLIHI